MSLTLGSFFGCSVISVNSSVGWNNGTQSQCKLVLIEDTGTFTPLNVGDPVYFTFGSFEFFGLLQSWMRRNSATGYPTYEVSIVDPRELLEATQVIVSDYAGSVQGVPNILNVFGWWEQNGFGESGLTDAGMPVRKVTDAIKAMTSSPAYGTYGGPITLRGYSYKLDLSELPIPPAEYRIGGPSLTLSDLISQICADAGCDYHIDLRGLTIRVRTVSRANQPPLGTISQFVASATGISKRHSSGLEMRLEDTCSFLIGGQKTTLFTTSDLTNFYGYDINGAPIVSNSGVISYKDANNNDIDTATRVVNLNASPIADILGSTIYTASIHEFRCAKANYETWASYIRTYKPQLANTLKIVDTFSSAGILSPVLRNDIINDAKRLADLMAKNAAAQDRSFLDSTAVYEFVKAHADEYWGRQYLVGLPQNSRKIDSETGKVSNAYDIAEGGWLDEGDSPLGILPINQDVFKIQDGRFRAFGRYDNVASGVDLTTVNPNGTIVQDESLFVPLSPDNTMLFVDDTTPYALVSLSEPLAEESIDTYGNLDFLKKVLHLPSGTDVTKLVQNGTVPLLIAPDVRDPDEVAIPLISNTDSYGVWFAGTTAGKTRFEKVDSLTPWNYGSVDAMNLAGQAMVNSAVTNTNELEYGIIELVGAPTVGLGDVLVTGGPNVTSVNISIGDEGIATTLEFRTFTPQFGTNSKQQIERLRRMSLAQNELRRSVRLANKEQYFRGGVIQSARNQKKFLENAAAAMKPKSPHDVLVGYSTSDLERDVLRTQVSSAKLEEALALSNSDNAGEYKSTAIMSMNGLVRPYATQVDFSSNMPYFSSSVSGDFPCRATLNPFKDRTDVEVVSHGESYGGLRVINDENAPTGVRAIGLKGPVVIAGWGYGVGGVKYPGDWNGDYLRDHSGWKAGPLDPLWDPVRGVWTFHTRLKGTVDYVPGGGSGLMTVNQAGESWSFYVHNYFSADVSGSSLKVFADYFPDENKYYIDSADCVE